MYASNEDEDWVYLTPTSKSNHVVPNDFVSNSSSSSSCSSRSERSTSVSSIDENSVEINDEVENVLQPVISTEQTLITDDEETKTFPINCDTDKTIFFSRTFSSSSETSNSRRFRRRTNSNDQQTDFSRRKEIRSTSIFSYLKRDRQYQNKDETLIAYIFMIILFVLPFFLGYSVSRWNQPTIEKIFKDLDRVHQRLNGLSSTPIEEALIAQVNTLTLQIQELQEDLHRTTKNLSFRIDQLTFENHRLRTEFRVQSKIDESSNNDSTKSFTEKFFNNFLHKTIFIADETSSHLVGFFHRFSESVTTLFDQTQDYFSHFKSSKQNQKETMTKTNSGRKYPWRWTFSKPNQCDDGRFPIKQIRSIRNWITKIIRR